MTYDDYDHPYDDVPDRCLTCIEDNESTPDWYCPFFDVSECEQANAADAVYDLTR
jgi:hypothetical protein